MLIIANIIAIFHGLVLVGLFVGPILLFSPKRHLALERGFLIIGGLTTLSFIITGACFLTTWEKQLRLAAEAPSYSGGFIRHYLGTIDISIPDIASTIIISLFIIIGFSRIIWLNSNLNIRSMFAN